MRTLFLILMFISPLLSLAQDCIRYEDYYPESPPYLGIVDTYSANDVAVSGTNAYVADRNAGIRVVSFVDPENPVIIGEVDTPGSAWGIDIEGNYAYVADVSGGLQIIDISNPEIPAIIGSLVTPCCPGRIIVHNQVAYVAAGYGDLQIIDVSDPTNPQLFSVLSFDSGSNMIAMSDGLIFVACTGPWLLHIVDVADVLAPEVISTVYFEATSGEGLAVDQGYAYWGAGDPGQEKVRVIDVSDPYNPQHVNSFSTPDRVLKMAVKDRTLYMSANDVPLLLASLHNPENPEIIGWLDSPGPGRGLEVTDEFVFHGVMGSGLVIGSLECQFIEVSPGGTGDHPSIQSAINAADNDWTVVLENGLFQGEGNRDLDFQGKAIALISRSNNPDSCIIDCEGTESEPHRGFLFQSGESSDAVIEGITIVNGYADEGGAIKCENGSSPTIRNCVLMDNYATSGGALHCSEEATPLVEYTLLFSNEAATGGALFIENSSPTFENCTISYNHAPLAGAAFLLYSTPSFESCILSNSIEGSAIYCVESDPILNCTDVVWNEGGDWMGCIADQQNENGNFSNTPAFCDPESGDFRLQPGSPCLPEHNDCGVLVGALGEGDCLPTGVEGVPTADRVALSAYPNPFNPHLTIMFSLPADANGSLTVHDVSGRQVRVLKDGQFAQGASEIVWNGQDDQGRDVASGVYFVRLTTVKHQESRKVILLQ